MNGIIQLKIIIFLFVFCLSGIDQINAQELQNALNGTITDSGGTELLARREIQQTPATNLKSDRSKAAFRRAARAVDSVISSAFPTPNSKVTANTAVRTDAVFSATLHSKPTKTRTFCPLYYRFGKK